MAEKMYYVESKEIIKEHFKQPPNIFREKKAKSSVYTTLNFTNIVTKILNKTLQLQFKFFIVKFKIIAFVLGDNLKEFSRRNLDN